MKSLQVDFGILGNHSASRELAAAIIGSLAKADSSAEVNYYDLAAEPIGRLTGTEFMAFQDAEPQDAVTKQNAD